MVSKSKVQEILMRKGVALEKIASDPRVYGKACKIAYKSIPFPLRWFVGKKRFNNIVDSLRTMTIKEIKKM
jgi:hypothetical protein